MSYNYFAQKAQSYEHNPARFDGIISSMTMHHVNDIAAMFRRFHEHVKHGEFIAIAGHTLRMTRSAVALSYRQPETGMLSLRHFMVIN